MPKQEKAASVDHWSIRWRPGGHGRYAEAP